MKKFLVKTILVVIVVLFFVRVGNKLLPVNSEIEQRIAKIHKPVDYVVFGSSHGSSFEFDDTMNGLRLNRGGNTIYYDLQNFKYADSKKIINNDAKIIITMSYFTFGWEEDRGIENFENEFYNYLPRRDIYNYSVAKEISMFFLNFQKGVFQKFIVDEPTVSKKRNVNLKKVGEERGSYHRRSVKHVYFQKNMQYLEEFISFARMKGYTPILVTPPFYSSYLNEFDSEWLDKSFYKNVNEIIRKEKVQYIDYSKNPIFRNNSSYFSDADHLNEKGREIFSKLFFEEIKQIK